MVPTEVEVVFTNDGTALADIYTDEDGVDYPNGVTTADLLGTQ